MCFGIDTTSAQIMKNMKQQFDPDRRLNPGRFAFSISESRYFRLKTTPTSSTRGFITADAPSEDDIYKCVQCGFCLNACPTYLETGLEAESPRGRLTLMKAVNEGRVDMTPTVTRHWDLCLQCRACEVACPSGVPYGRIMMATRAEMKSRVKASAP